MSFCRKYGELVFNFKRSYDQTLRGLTYKNAEVLWHSYHRCSCKGCCLLEHIFLRSPLTNTWTKLHDNQWRSKEKVLARAHVYRSPLTNTWTNMTIAMQLSCAGQCGVCGAVTGGLICKYAGLSMRFSNGMQCMCWSKTVLLS